MVSKRKQWIDKAMEKKRKTKQGGFTGVVDYQRFSFNPKTNTPLPAQLKTQFRYAETFSMNPSLADVASTYLFSLNGLYDPNYTGIGHQPRGFDQLMALYDHYVVIGTTITLRVANQNSSANQQALVSMILLDGSVARTSFNDIFESQGIHKILQINTGGASTEEMKLDVNPNKFLGRSKPLSDPQLKGDAANNPDEQAYVQVSCINAVPGTDLGSLCFSVVIEYTTVLIEPKLPSQS